jgi:hypothetical protein
METKNNPKSEASKEMNTPKSSKPEKDAATKQTSNSVPRKRRHVLL